MDDIQSLRLFVAVAEEHSFSAAARRHGVSASVVTRKISQLEQQLNTRLFNRSTRRVELSRAGEMMFAHVVPIIAAVDECIGALQTEQTLPEGRLRIICRAGVGRRIITPVLAEFRQRFPGISIGLELTEARSLPVLESGCDVGLTIGHLEDSSLVARRIFTTDSMMYASPEYLAKHGEPQHPLQLPAHQCMTFMAESGQANWRFSKDGEQFEVHISATLAINDADSLLAAACDGHGILMVADWFAKEAMESGRLKRVLADFQVDPRGTPITALYPSRRYLSRKVGVFLDFLEESCAERFL